MSTTRVKLFQSRKFASENHGFLKYADVSLATRIITLPDAGQIRLEKMPGFDLKYNVLTPEPFDELARKLIIFMSSAEPPVIAIDTQLDGAQVGAVREFLSLFTYLKQAIVEQTAIIIRK